jgi:ribA/ribD-fused uncharacterized protein
MGKGPYLNGLEIPELGNYFRRKIVIHGLTFHSVEQFFQYSKCVSDTDRQLIMQCDDPKECARIGRRVTLRPDWEEVKLAVMREATMTKFSQNPELVEILRRVGTGFRFCEDGVAQDDWDKMNQSILDEIIRLYLQC